MLKRDRTTFSKNDNYCKLNNQHKWEQLYDDLVSMKFLTSMMECEYGLDLGLLIILY